MNIGKLSFKNRFTNYLVNSISQSTTGDSVDNELELDNEETHFLVIECTGEQYTKLFSAVMQGADLLYGEDAHEITWIIWKAAKVETFCEKVASCITNSPEVHEALTNIGIENFTSFGIGSNTTILSPAIREANMLPDDYTCNNDHRYGMAIAIVESIHDATIEIMQAIEVLTNPAELAAEIADNVPMAEAFFIALEMINWIQDIIYEAYNLAWSDTTRDEIACELFCEMQELDPCHLDYEMIMDVYLDPAFPNPPSMAGDWTSWMTWLFMLPVTAPTATVKMAGLLGLLVMRYGGAFGKFSLGIYSFKTAALLASDEVNADWALLCTSCPTTWAHEWDFENYGLEAWTLVDNQDGAYVVGEGMECRVGIPLPDWEGNMVDRMLFNEPIPRMSGFKLTVDYTVGEWDAPSTAVYCTFGYQAYGNKSWTNAYLNGLREFTNSWAVHDTGDFYLFLKVSHNRETGNNGYGVMRSIIMSGEGLDPFYGRVTALRHEGES